MKVLFFHRANDYTGSTRALANLIETAYSNHDVYVVTTDIKRKGFLSELSNVHIKRAYYPTINGERIKLISYLLNSIHTFLIALTFGFRFEQFYINTIQPYQAAIAGRLLRKEIVYHVHEKLIGNGLEQHWLEFIFNHTKATRIYVSYYVKSQYPPKEPSVVKYNKLPHSFRLKVVPALMSERVPDRIIMIASLSVAKGVLNFITLAGLLPEYHFTLVLNTDRKTIDSFFGTAIPANVELVSAQANIHPFLHKADLLLNLSIPLLSIETFGLTILEAMAYGIPAVVPNIGGPTELVINDFNGYCVDVTNLDLVKDTIRQCMKKDNYVRLANNAEERFRLFA
jgi:glycosyltransferase involved in cell wall biosynthesis